MRKMWRRIFGTAALALMLCLTGLVMSGEAQAERFTDNLDGTVTDNVTKLMWTKDAALTGRMLKWNDAVAACRSFSISGIGGWRLPSEDELVTLAHAIRGKNPFYNVVGTPYWSSTTDEEWFPGHAIGVYVTSGGRTAMGPQEAPSFVWPVRP